VVGRAALVGVLIVLGRAAVVWFYQKVVNMMCGKAILGGEYLVNGMDVHKEVN
jgi:hypothetical protein